MKEITHGVKRKLYKLTSNVGFWGDDVRFYINSFKKAEVRDELKRLAKEYYRNNVLTNRFK